MDPSDTELTMLIAAVAKGSCDALERLMSDCMPRVYGLALRITRDAGVAEEVAQDAFVKVWDRAAQFDRNVESASAWVLTICRTCALGARSREARVATCQDQESDLQDLLVATRGSSSVHAAISSLDPELRRMLELAYFENLSPAALADQLEMPLDVVRSNLCLAVDLLRLTPDRLAA